MNVARKSLEAEPAAGAHMGTIVVPRPERARAGDGLSGGGGDGKHEAAVSALSVTGVTVVYPNGVCAVDDASFTLAEGSICGLVGVNGSGKSTLFKAIMGFVRPTHGSVEIFGASTETAMAANDVAYVPQSENVDWDFPVLVEDVVMMGRYGRMGFLRIPSRDDRAIVASALEQVAMAEFAKRQIGELSGGQKKRVFLARALAQRARLILLDEPFTGVDVKTEHAIIDLLNDLRDSGHVVLVSTHNLGSIPDFCDHVVLVKQRIIAAGATADTFTQANLERAFGGVLRHFRLEGASLHDDDDARAVTVLTDDERPVVFYGAQEQADRPLGRRQPRPTETGSVAPSQSSKARRSEAEDPGRFPATDAEPAANDDAKAR